MHTFQYSVSWLWTTTTSAPHVAQSQNPDEIKKMSKRASKPTADKCTSVQVFAIKPKQLFCAFFRRKICSSTIERELHQCGWRNKNRRKFSLNSRLCSGVHRGDYNTGWCVCHDFLLHHTWWLTVWRELLIGYLVSNRVSHVFSEGSPDSLQSLVLSQKTIRGSMCMQWS